MTRFARVQIRTYSFISFEKTTFMDSSKRETYSKYTFMESNSSDSVSTRDASEDDVFFVEVGGLVEREEELGGV